MRCDIRLRSIKVSGLDSTCVRAHINDTVEEGEGRRQREEALLYDCSLVTTIVYIEPHSCQSNTFQQLSLLAHWI